MIFLSLMASFFLWEICLCGCRGIFRGLGPFSNFEMSPGSFGVVPVVGLGLLAVFGFGFVEADISCLPCLGEVLVLLGAVVASGEGVVGLLLMLLDTLVLVVPGLAPPLVSGTHVLVCLAGFGVGLGTAAG